MRLDEQRLINTIRLALWSVSLLLIVILSFTLFLLFPPRLDDHPVESLKVESTATWSPPDTSLIPKTPEGDLIRLGHDLIAHTSRFRRAEGSGTLQTNGMNCQNCHLEAGRKPWGNNFSAVASTYPKFRGRSGSIESIEKRVNDCLERSLNGQPLDVGSREMTAMVAYIRWVGSGVAQNHTPIGAGIADLPLLNRAADPGKGKKIYAAACARCHGPEGKGAKLTASEWQYPPLWGDQSFNTGAGILRLSRMAGFIQRNMPNEPVKSLTLSTEEAWDVAAFVCSQPRPAKDLSGDWPDIRTKPFDYPFGPFADEFTEEQHRLGPFAPIIAARKSK